MLGNRVRRSSAARTIVRHLLAENRARVFHSGPATIWTSMASNMAGCTTALPAVPPESGMGAIRFSLGR